MYENWGLPDYCQLMYSGSWERGLTKRRTKANAKQNTNGPAKSASSMILLSGLRIGLSTVNDF
jgi:hypothetical protein